MTDYAPPVLKARGEQMYFALTKAEVARLRRFGNVRYYAQGDVLIRAGETGLGMLLLLQGRARVSRRDGLGHEELITVYKQREFIAESGQLSGLGSFVDAHADTAIKALVVSPQGLRDIVIAEAELGERIMRALILRRVGLIESGAGGPIVVGAADDPRVLRLQTFFTRNGVPHRALASAEAEALLEVAKPSPDDLPLVICPNGEVLKAPSDRAVAEGIGMILPLDSTKTYDMAVVGAGPAGLASAVYGASEGLSVVVLEAHAAGGQAGASSRIENYLGFPTGVRGAALAGRAYIQAQKFGADIFVPTSVTDLERACAGTYTLRLEDGSSVKARSVVIASGAQYRRLDAPGLKEADEAGVHYWASPIEANLCAGQEVALVGAGNAAGQAAVFLASHAKKVWMLVRRPGLEPTMSRYLVDRIKAQPNIQLVTDTVVDSLQVDALGTLRTVSWRGRRDRKVTVHPIRHLFLFVGALPCTGWLQECGVATDPRRFVLTGTAARPNEATPKGFMTSLDGVFAIGDARSGSTKRVASAVGEGSAVVAQVQAYLATAASLDG